MAVPVLLLVFNRPEHTRQVMERLRQLRPARLYVHADGPRAGVPGETEKVAAVRAAVAQAVDWPCTVQQLYRTDNAGLREGVYGALNWFFQQEEAGIILEDDCRPDASFFRFCAELLERYRDEEQIMHIGGSNLIESRTKVFETSYVFSRFSFVWGWASWRRAWQKMSLDLEGLDEFIAARDIRSLVSSPLAQIYMLEKFRVTQQKINRSWGYAWFYSILKNNGLCIVPTINLVQNVGVGEAGATNTAEKNDAARLAAGSMDFPLRHPAKRQPDTGLEQAFFYASQKQRRRLLLWYALRKLGLRRQR